MSTAIRTTPAEEPTAPRSADDRTAWFVSSTPQLRPDAEVLSGLDDRPLLFLADSGRYVAIGREVVPLLDTFDGTLTGAEIVDRVRSDRPRAEVEARLARVAHDLRQAGALTEEREAVDTRSGIARFMRKEHLLRLPLTRRIGDALEPLVAPLRAIPGRLIVAVWLVLAAVGLVLGAGTLVHGREMTIPATIWMIYPVLFLQIVFHELSHALVCQYLRVPVREAGIGLMLYVMPVGYVDRTDSYRVTDRRSRAFLSLAGPVNDQIWFGATALVALLVPGQVGDLAFSLLIFQALLTVMNFNPLTPSDGYHAVSALAGAVNIRGQALQYLAHLVLRLPLTPAMAATSAKRRRFFLGYALACLVFVAVLVGGLVRTVLTVTETLS